MSSAAEAELGALYINSRKTVPQRHLLEEMGHPQPPTPIQVDNTTALGVVKNTIQPKQTKAMDIWDSTGSDIVPTKNISEPTGEQDQQTMKATWQNIIEQFITDPLVQLI